MKPIQQIPAEEKPAVAGPDSQPKYRVRNATHMLALIDGAFKRIKFQIEQDRMVTDAYDRMPPLDPAELAKSGEEWRTNVDYGDTEKGIDEKVELLNNLMRLPMPLIDFKTHRAKSHPSIVDKLNLVALEYDFLLTESTMWTTEGQDLCHQMVKTGLGIMYHPHPYSWHFESVERCNIVYPPRAGLNPEKWPWFAIRKKILLTDLIAKLDENSSTAATAMGWDMAKVRKMVQELPNWGDGGKPHDSEKDPEGFVNAVQENDLYYANLNGNSVDGFTVYIKEFDGKITEHILVEKGEYGFIYTSKQRYDNMTDFIQLFPLAVGQKFLEKVRGYGHKILPFNALINDMRNRAVDVTNISSGLMLKGSKDDDIQDITQLMLGNLVTLIPNEMSMDQRAFSNPAQGIIALEQSFKGEREANNRVFGGASGNASGVQTATHAKILANQDSRNNSFETDRFYVQLTLFHRSVWRRLEYFAQKGDQSPPCPGRDEALAFWRELATNGVTAADMGAIRSVMANSLFGDGDPNQVFLALDDLSGLLPSLPVSAQRQALKMMIAARTRKPYLAEAWLPSNSSSDRDRSIQLWRTATEHNSFETGGPMPNMDDDITTIHAEEHTKWCEGVIQNMEQGILQPAEALQRLILARDHTAPHMQLLAASKQDEALYRDLAKRWQGIVNMMRRAQQMVDDAKMAEQARQLEELRTPRLSVAEQEAILTGQAKRQALMETEEFRRSEISRTENLKRDLLKKGALTKAQLAVIDSIPLATEPPTQNEE